jgi:hypothetical protein
VYRIKKLKKRPRPNKGLQRKTERCRSYVGGILRRLAHGKKYWIIYFKDWHNTIIHMQRLCGLVVRIPGYRSRGPGFDSRRYQIF